MLNKCFKGSHLNYKKQTNQQKNTQMALKHKPEGHLEYPTWRNCFNLLSMGLGKWQGMGVTWRKQVCEKYTETPLPYEYTDVMS